MTIHDWQPAQQLARALGVSLYKIHKHTPGRIETRALTPDDVAKVCSSRVKAGRVPIAVFRVKEGFTVADFAKRSKPPRNPAPVDVTPPPMPAIPPRKREPIALRLKGSPPDSPPIGYLFAEPPPGAVKPITIMPATLTWRTGDGQDFTEKVAELIARAFPDVGVVTVAVGLGMEMHSARLMRAEDEP